MCHSLNSGFLGAEASGVFLGNADSSDMEGGTSLGFSKLKYMEGDHVGRKLGRLTSTKISRDPGKGTSLGKLQGEDIAEVS